MPGRSFSTPSYRYGFNGKEKDDEVKENGNSLDFEARIYDSRLGKWLSLDPLMNKLPALGPYAFCANNPILFLDANGKILENGVDKDANPKEYLRIQTAIDVVKQVLPGLYDLAQNGRLNEKGHFVMPGDAGYEEATPIVISVIIADVDNKPADKERDKFFDNTLVFQSKTSDVDGDIDIASRHQWGKTAFKKNEDGSYSYLSNIDFNKSETTYTPLTLEESNSQNQNPPFVKHGIKDNKTLIRIDDFLNFTSSDAEVLSHELGHYEGEVKNLLNVYYNTQVSPDKKGGH